MEHLVEEAAIAYNQKYTPEEYLNMEWENGQRYEYWDGELLAMAGSSINHSKINVNLIIAIDPHVRTKGCGVFGTDTMLKMLQSEKYFLPDIMVSCQNDDPGATQYLHNPSIILEVLSKSTELYDRAQKWDQYKKIKSLRHYLLVSQYEYKVEMFSRANEQTLFYYQSFERLDQVITFKDFGFEISLSEIYRGISFTSKEKT